MPRIFISVGSNIEPEDHVRQALARLAQAMRVVAISTVYLTPPLDRPEQPPFYNAVVEVETALAPRELKRTLREIETALGRVRSDDKYAPRPIDLDILLYGDAVIAEPELTIPDPNIPARPFLAIPLAELATAQWLPGTRRPLRAIAAQLDTSDMEPLPEYTAQLRIEVLR